MRKRAKELGKLSGLILSCSIFGLLQSCTSSVAGYTTPAVGDERLDVGGDVEIFSWWTSGGEREALSALIAVHEDRVSNARVQNAAAEYADKARAELSARFQEGFPPDTFQANCGADLFDWVQANGRDASDSKVESLHDMAVVLDWKKVFDREVLESVSYDDEIYAVPLNLHRINSLFYRKDLFDKFSLELPTSIEELNALCRTIQTSQVIQESSPNGVACLALGNKYNWTFSQLTFELLLPAMAGPKFYEDYFSGKKTALAPEIRAVLEQARLMYCGDNQTAHCERSGWFNPDVDDLTWDEGIRKLTDGAALMAPMGDWAKGYLQSKAGGNMKSGVDFDVIPFPRAPEVEPTFVFTADTFPLPRGAANRDGARSLLKTFASKEGQIAFSKLKGSIPARIDIDRKEFDEMSQQTMQDFEESTKVRAMSGLLHGANRETMSSELGASLDEGNMAIISRYLEANYPIK